MSRNKAIIRDHVQRLIEHLRSLELTYAEYEHVHKELLQRIR